MTIQNQVAGFGESQFGDKRLDKRFSKIIEEFQKNPQAILSHVFQNAHQCKAAYRFFNNPNVSNNKIIASHHDMLISFLKSNENTEILEIQDTTECDFTTHPKTTGMGKLGCEKSKRKGLECHTSLIVTSDGLTLGIGSINLWARNELKRNGKKNIRKIPIKEKESFKWLNSVEAFDTSKLNNLSRVVIADREADFYEFIDFICATNKKMVIRLRWDRKTEEGLMIKEALQNTTTKGYTKITIKPKGGIETCREEHEVELAICYSNLTITAPKNIDKTTIYNEKLNLTIVHVKEINPRNIEEPLEWYLITNVEVKIFDDALKIMRWYSYRWLVEEFHKILKAGIKIEEARLSEKPRLEKLITFLSVMAVKILWMTRINRIDPQAPMELVLSENEIKVLSNHAKKKIQKQLNSIDDAIRYIASLGGFKGRKCDGNPGLLTLWRGLIRFYDILDGADL